MTTVLINEETVKKAFKFLNQGKLGMALPLFKQLIENGRTEFEKEYSECQSLIKRRAWKKGDLTLFKSFSNNNPETALALARLEGRESLQNLANENSQNGLLAGCLLMDDPKSALLKMRKDPQLADIANGWFALLKGDANRALDYFSQAEKTEPIRSQIGKGIAHLQNNDLIKAEEALLPLKSIAIHKYPSLAQSMGWHNENKPSDSIEDQARYLLLKGDLQAFEKMSPLLIKSNLPLKPWILMRHGDLFYFNNRKKEGYLKWQKALNGSAALNFDVKKRSIILDYEEGELNKAESVLVELYKSMQKKDPLSAKELLETYLFSKDSFPHKITPTPDYCIKTNTWLVENPAVELHFLIFKRTVNILNFISSEYEVEDCMDEVITREELPSLSYWKEVLPILDQTYGTNETYLSLKINLFKYYQENCLLQESYATLYKLNPSRAKESFENYTQLAISSNDKDSTKKQVNELISILPPSFRLAQLHYYCNKDQKALDIYTSHFSPSLKKTLKLSLFACKESIEEYLLPIDLVGLDLESDYYLTVLYIMISHSLSDHTKYLESYYEKLFSDSKNCIHIYEKILKSSQLYELDFYLKKWIEVRPTDWTPFYYLGLEKIERGDFKNAINLLKEAIKLIDKQDPQYLELKTILEGLNSRIFW